MHMADALISPAVGATMWTATIALMAYSVKKVQEDHDDKKVPLMGVMGAFIFAAQMINFSIPATGSSGHLGGGLLLAALLGPYAGFLTMSSVLIIQALFFGDGGLLALGCNIFNLGFYTCFVAYPLVYKTLLRGNPHSSRLYAATLLAAVLGLQFGSVSVVAQTALSGRTELPFRTFLLLMQPIHLAIGLVEGLVTVAVLKFIAQARPEMLDTTLSTPNRNSLSRQKVLLILTGAALSTGAMFSWFASEQPDGLEWSMSKIIGQSELTSPQGIHDTLANLQNHTSLLPDYSFKKDAGSSSPAAPEAPPHVDAARSLSGVLGGALTLLLAGSIGFIMSRMKRHKRLLKAV
jgi:cobalt/nickel transport system permease protein